MINLKNMMAASRVVNPLNIANLQLWLDAADTSTITESSGSVSQVDDKSGNANHFTQGTASKQPATNADTVNGHNVLTFDGTSDVLTSSFPWPLDNTFFVVFKPTVASSSSFARRVITSFDGSGGIADGENIVDYIDGADPFTLRKLAFGSTISSANVIYKDVTCVVSGTGDSTANVQEVFLNGVSQGTGAYNATAATKNVYIGEDTNGGSGAEFFGGKFCELIFYDRVLSSYERELVEYYLKIKWDI